MDWSMALVLGIGHFSQTERNYKQAAPLDDKE